MAKINKTLAIYNKLKKFPFGKKIFSLIVGHKAPYFSSISAKVIELEANQCTCVIKKHKAVFNHIKTIHAIAICNGLEMAMGIMAEASMPKYLRWIPKGMEVEYTAKAGSDIRCIATMNAADWQPGDLFVQVTALDENDVVVVKGKINLWITEKLKI